MALRARTNSGEAGVFGESSEAMTSIRAEVSLPALARISSVIPGKETLVRMREVTSWRASSPELAASRARRAFSIVSLSAQRSG